MNFFSNLFNDVKDVFSTAGQRVADTFTTSIPNFLGNVGGAIGGLFTGSGSNTASAADAAASAIASKASANNPNQTISTQSQPYLGKDAYGNSTYAVNGQPVVVNPYGQPNSLATTIARSGSIGQSGYQPSALQIGASQSLGMPRPLIQSPATRVSTPLVGNPYADPNTGQQVTPLTAFSGESGQSSGQDFNFGALTPTTGAPGLAGGSAFTGTLGASGLYSSSPLSGLGTQEDQAKQKKIQDAFSSLAKKGSSPVPGITPNASGSPVTGGVTTPATNGVPSPYFNVVPQGPVSPLQAPTVPESHNATDLGRTSTPVLNSSSASAVSDVHGVNASINENFQREKSVLDHQYPSDPVTNPMTTDTKEQLQFADQSNDPYGVKAALDAYKASNTSLVDLESQRLDVLKSIKALTSAYQPIINDIKNNPDLPKGLALRRLTDLNTKQKDTLVGFQNQLELLNQSISDQNEQVNRAFNIVTFSSNQAEKATDNARLLLNTMVTTGAIGGMSDAELAQLAKSTGVPFDGLKKARAAANDPVKNIDIQTDDSGTVRGIDKLSGKVYWTLTGAGKSNASAAGGGTDSAYASQLVQQLSNRNSGVTFASLPKEDKQLAIQAFASAGLTIPRPLTQQEKNAADQATAGLTSLQNIVNLKNTKGLPLSADFYTPSGGVFGAIGTSLNPDLSQYRNWSNEVSDIITRIRTGAALNENEIKFYNGKLPKLGDSDAAVTNKLNQLTGFFLGMSGLPVTVVSPDGKTAHLFNDLYDPKQRLEVRNAIDQGYTLSY